MRRAQASSACDASSCNGGRGEEGLVMCVAPGAAHWRLLWHFLQPTRSINLEKAN